MPGRLHPLIPAARFPRVAHFGPLDSGPSLLPQTGKLQLLEVIGFVQGQTAVPGLELEPWSPDPATLSI